MNELAVEARGLTKSFARVTVLSGVDVSVERGSVFALLGPNGAGKTTMVRILATLTTMDSGTARVAGHDVLTERAQVRRRISVTGQFAAVDDGQTGRENVVMTARLAGHGRRDARRRAEELLDLFDLSQAADRLVRTYSGGMRRRLDLAAGLVSRPDVIFLDEPTAGLDPRSRQDTWELVARLAQSGTTVFLTTQYLEEADRLADQIAVLDGGVVVAQGSAGALKARFARHRIDLVTADDEAFRQVVQRLGSRAIRVDAERREVAVPTGGQACEIRAMLDELDPSRTALRLFAVHTATLDDVFLALTDRDASARRRTQTKETIDA